MKNSATMDRLTADTMSMRGSTLLTCAFVTLCSLTPNAASSQSAPSVETAAAKIPYTCGNYFKEALEPGSNLLEYPSYPAVTIDGQPDKPPTSFQIQKAILQAYNRAGNRGESYKCLPASTTRTNISMLASLFIFTTVRFGVSEIFPYLLGVRAGASSKIDEGTH